MTNPLENSQSSEAIPDDVAQAYFALLAILGIDPLTGFSTIDDRDERSIRETLATASMKVTAREISKEKVQSHYDTIKSHFKNIPRL